MMKQNNPWDLFPNSKEEQKQEQTLEKQPCSVLAICLAQASFKMDSGKSVRPKVDKTGYCKLKDIDAEIKEHFEVESYKYFQGKDRKKLKEFTKFPGKYIVCVKGHYILAVNEDYYSFFDNGEDEVIAFWKLTRVKPKIHVLKIEDKYKKAIDDGKKQFELRKDDRNFKVGHKIHFIRTDETQFSKDPNNEYEITYKLDNCPQYGLLDGYCILGIKRVN